MKLNELLLAQLEREAQGTRETLAHLPEGQNDWRPHAKSMPLGQLAVLVARMASWPASVVDADELDLAVTPTPAPAATNQELIEIHDQSLAAARKSLASTNDEHLMKTWRMRFGDKVLDERPRHVIIADTISHLAHHRAQLTVYLRLNDRPVPGIYGPSADTSW